MCEAYPYVLHACCQLRERLPPSCTILLLTLILAASCPCGSWQVKMADFQQQQLLEVDSYINQPLHAIEYDHGGYGNRQGWSVGAHYGALQATCYSRHKQLGIRILAQKIFCV